jgi:hypothetical protein
VGQKERDWKMKTIEESTEESSNRVVTSMEGFFERKI